MALDYVIIEGDTIEISLTGGFSKTGIIPTPTIMITSGVTANLTYTLSNYCTIDSKKIVKRIDISIVVASSTTLVSGATVAGSGGLSVIPTTILDIINLFAI